MPIQMEIWLTISDIMGIFIVLYVLYCIQRVNISLVAYIFLFVQGTNVYI